MNDNTSNQLGEKFAEWYLADEKKASFKKSQYENGIKMLQMTVQERGRITIFDIHAQAAKEMGELMIKWADENQSEDG